MNVYGGNMMSMEHDKFLTFIQLVFEFLPSLLRKGGIIEYFPDKVLNELWKFKGGLEPMVKK